LILCISLLSLSTGAQVIFKTEVPRLPVTLGEAFPVQYIIEDLGLPDDFRPPSFPGFRIARGPDIYRGTTETATGKKSLKNIFYTLVATKPGKFIIRGATAVVDGHEIKSDDQQIEVINVATGYLDASGGNSSGYFLLPGEDPHKKIQENLFMKVMVNKRNCYVGQPVVATFKLYSRLQSKTDIVKNPGFYGFTVQDMVALDDHLSASEIINGKKFDVHTIRTVQLYPLQAGIFTIDPMEVLNKVEFSRSIVNKKPEQVIVEGVFEDSPKPANNDNTLLVENNISTRAITINVKPYPARNKPEGFQGATGKFKIKGYVDDRTIPSNEQGELIISIEGKGNFTQIIPPTIKWPEGIEGFDARITDSLDKSGSPLTGKRVFHFPFVSGKTGKFKLTGVSFSFFDPDSNNYRTITTSPVELVITDSLQSDEPVANTEKQAVMKQPNNRWLIAVGILSAITGLFIIFLKKKKKPVQVQTLASSIMPDIDQSLQPAEIALKINAPQFYTTLQKNIWDYLGATLQLSGSRMNKNDLEKTMNVKGLSEDHAAEILQVLAACEAGAFTSADLNADREQLFTRAKAVLGAIKI
jgi:hypothetical protein